MNAKRQRFIEEYLKDLNGKQAAIRAGYSGRTAKEQASRLLANVNVRAALQQAQSERSERTKVTIDRVVTELAKLGFSDLRDVASWGPEGMAWKDSGELSDDAAASVKKVTVHQEIRRDRNGDEIITVNSKITLHDKKSALELLGRHRGLFRDNVNVGVDRPVVVRVKGLSWPNPRADG